MALFFREIAAFAGIVCDVEEIFVVGDLQVFPTTPPDRALVAVTHAPIERVFEFRRPAGQYRQQIDPVERVAGGRSNPGRREAGCGQVHRDGHLIGYAPRLDTARPAADLRHPQPALQQIELAADKWPDFRKPLAAVIAGEYDERVVVARPLANCIKHAADAGIQGLHHFAVDARVSAFGQFGALDLALPCGGLDRGSRPRPVRRRVMEAQEIWFGPRRRRGDPGNCPFTQYIRDVACPLDGDFALVEIVFAAIADMSVVSGEPAHYSKEFVIAALQRAVARQISEMPFPDKRGAIAGAAQQ